MRADSAFANEPLSFWAYVRVIGESAGYSKRNSDRVSVFSIEEMRSALDKLGRPSDVLGSMAAPSSLGTKLREYFRFRAEILNEQVRRDLMTLAQAQEEYDNVKRSVSASDRSLVLNSKQRPTAVEYLVGESIVRVPLNKQTGEKRAESYMTGMVNLLIAHELRGHECDYDPRRIPVIDHDGLLAAALSRRMDGSFPSVVNPVAMWEIKEYYYTTTFGSKISDAVYITSLDGYERRELEQGTGQQIEHTVMVDAYDTWWRKGKSYLCRLTDALHMGHVDEILFGREVRRRLPELVPKWMDALAARESERISLR